MADTTSGSADARPDSPITTIEFHGADLIVRAGDNPSTTLVAMKPVVEGMGLAWQAQHAKLKAHPLLSKGITEFVIPSAGGPQAMTALPLNRLHFWLATIQPNKVRPDLRDRVLTYQGEAADVLFAHFFGQKRARRRARPVPPPRAAAGLPAKDGRFLVVIRGGQVVTTVDVDGFCLLDGGNTRSVATFLREEMATELVPAALEAIAARLAGGAGAPTLRAPRWPTHPHIRERIAGPGEILQLDASGKAEILPGGFLAIPVIGGGYRIFSQQKEGCSHA